MIKITHKNLDKIAQEHYEQLKNKFEDFPNNSKYDLEEIITAKPKQLDQIAKWYENLDKSEKEKYNFTNLYTNFIKKKKEYDAYDLAKNLNINTCVYCNINPTYTVITKNKKNVIRPEFDHFYNKNDYPILALSFYNLIPSCHTCNSSLKGKTKFTISSHIHPYIQSFDKFAKFNLHVKNSKFYYDIDGFDIEVKSNYKKAQNSINTFRLNDLYQNYKDIVLELIQKEIVYNDSYIEELMKNYEGILFKNEEDLMRFITCNYISEDDLHKRPLSKLTKDISKELELI